MPTAIQSAIAIAVSTYDHCGGQLEQSHEIELSERTNDMSFSENLNAIV